MRIATAVWRSVSEDGLLLTVRRSLGSILRGLRSAVVARQVGARRLSIGRDTTIRGLKHIRIGERFTAGDGLWLEAITNYQGQHFKPQIIIGNSVNVSNWSHIAATNRVEIGDGTLIGSKVIIIDHNHGIYSGQSCSPPGVAPGERPLSCDRGVIIGRNVWLADGVLVLPGAIIGEGAIVGGNSVVRGTIPPFSMVAGSPAKIIKIYDFETKGWVNP